MLSLLAPTKCGAHVKPETGWPMRGCGLDVRLFKRGARCMDRPRSERPNHESHGPSAVHPAQSRLLRVQHTARPSVSITVAQMSAISVQMNLAACGPCIPTQTVRAIRTRFIDAPKSDSGYLLSRLLQHDARQASAECRSEVFVMLCDTCLRKLEG